ncbi:MAG TPA: trehalase family glycosidase [Flavobacterium sp.]|nr:trehalase family glycosidase [Flavobacterium sp.]
MKSSIYQLAALALCLASANVTLAQDSKIISKNNEYTVFSDGVKQGQFSAKALSANELVSDYQSPKNESVSSRIEFKFSINGKDNEMKAGVNHLFNFTQNASETPLIKFGEPLKLASETETQIKPDSKLKIRLDLRNALTEIKSKGYFTTFKGDKIFKEDFKHVYVAGATAPLSWDFDNLHQKPELEMKDPDGDGIYETELIFNAKKDQKVTAGNWKQTKNTSAFPQYSSNYMLTDALYNLALEEMINAVEPDSTFRTGKEWAGVWTRDISYSIILSMANLQPKVAMNSLMRKVNANKRIIQDTGTGGAYPCSTDRIVWATAAWEVYKTTGDKKWLESSYEIIKNSIEDDYLVAYDYETGLVRGESSFLDWREQTYPRWMQPADIYESENLGTNAVHYQANVILSEMAKILNHNDVSEKHKALAEKIKTGINKYLWMADKGYYAQYLYGRNFKIQSARSEALGEALCVLFGIADAEKAQSVVAKTPVTVYGISCLYPQIPGIPPYHNNAVWPFVQSYWALASAKSGNENSVLESIAAIDRPAALFLTNKENFVAGNGDYAGTEINSSNMLWSLSGSLSIIHKVIFGMEFQSDKLVFHPFVPRNLEGARTLSNYKYRNAVLDIAMEGFGNTIKSFTLDGKSVTPEIPATLKGKHSIKIILDNSLPITAGINKKENYFSPETPSVTLKNEELSWPPIENAAVYQILKNGKIADQTAKSTFRIPTSGYSEYQVIAVDANGVSSFASEPLMVSKPENTTIYEVETLLPKADFPYKGFSGNGFVETSKTSHSKMEFPITVNESGMYMIDFRYANGNGPTNTENKCAIRSLKEKDKFLGTFVFPQRGVQEWSNWGFSNGVKVYLEKGKHNLVLVLDPANENMNGAVNQAMLDYLRLVKID